MLIEIFDYRKLYIYVYMYTHTHTHTHTSSVISDSFATPWTVACQAPLSMEFSRQEYWRGLPFPTPGDLPDPRSEAMSPMSHALTGGFFTTMSLGKPICMYVCMCVCVCVCVCIYIYIYIYMNIMNPCLYHTASVISSWSSTSCYLYPFSLHQAHGLFWSQVQISQHFIWK